VKVRKLVPKRRFEGFTSKWEDHKLDDVAIYRRGSFPQPYGNEEWYDEENGMPFVQVVDVGKNLKLVDDTKQKISKLAQPNSVFVEEGKILVTLQGSIGRVAITQYPSFIDRTLLLFESYKLPINNFYFAYTVQRLFEREKLKAPGGTIKTITKEALSKFLIYLPCIDEQQKIGEFFMKLDQMMTLEQRKLEKIEVLKSAYLAEMFLAEGERVPKRRFAGFNDEWKQQKLNKVADYRSGKAHERNVVDNGEYIIVNSKFVSTNGRTKKFSNIQIEPLKKGELAFVLSDIPNGKALAKTFLIDRDNLFTLNQRIAGITPKENTDSYFLKVLMNRHEYFLKFDGGVGQTNLSNADIENFESSYPSFEEQKRIGNFFKQLEYKIMTQQQKLDKLKAMKQAYLQEMFV